VNSSNTPVIAKTSGKFQDPDSLGFGEEFWIHHAMGASLHLSALGCVEKSIEHMPASSHQERGVDLHFAQHEHIASAFNMSIGAT
jgi:hypothetical protein